MITLENGKLLHKQKWDGKETTVERDLQDGKLVAVSHRTFLNNPGICPHHVEHLMINVTNSENIHMVTTRAVNVLWSV